MDTPALPIPPPATDTIPPAAHDATLEQWLQWQNRLHFTAVELGLDRCGRVAQAMGLTAPGHVVITVAGTNGKGSSAIMLNRILRAAGYRTGCFTSPHLVRYNERILVNGAEAGDAELCAAFRRIDAARAGITLTYFEFGTLAALDLFQRAAVDVAILEVGLGGRLDAVNILDADTALVCSIDLDHQEWLGPDRSAIGLEKAGIFRAGRPAVCSDDDPPPSIAAHAARIGAALYQKGVDYQACPEGDTWTWHGNHVTHTGLPWPDPGNPNQLSNAAGVIQVLESLAGRLPVTARALREGLAGFQLAGRLQRVPGAVEYVLDVAHNRQAAGALARSLERLAPAASTHLVVGMLRDKDHGAVLDALRGVADYWYVTGLPGERGTSPGVLERQLERLRVPGAAVRSCGSAAQALQAAAGRAEPGDRIVVTGSFLTVGAALTWLGLEH